MPIRTVFDHTATKLSRKLLPYLLRESFTAGMAKRLPSAGPFAAGVMVQGKWASAVGDVVSIGRGTLVSGDFYSNWDMNQGSVVFWITPEWSESDTATRDIIRGATWAVQKNSTNLRFVAASGVALTSSISGWTAGTTYCVVIRWDTKNTLDGTNYICISLNDAHTFGRTTTWTPPTPDSTIYIGAYTGPIDSSDALIQGLTIYRRPLWDAHIRQRRRQRR